MTSSAAKRIDIEDFKDVLNNEIEVYDTIETLLVEKKDLIARRDTLSLQKVDTRLESLTQQARTLEKDRLAIMVKMGRQEGETLREFIGSVENEADQRLITHAREHLVKTTSDITRLSQTNQTLLTQSIRLIEQSVEVIAAMLTPDGAAYTRAGSQKSSKHTAQVIQSPQIKSTVSYDG